MFLPLSKTKCSNDLKVQICSEPTKIKITLLITKCSKDLNVQIWRPQAEKIEFSIFD